MSPETLLWMRVGHIFGFIMWTGTMVGLLNMLREHAAATDGERPVLVRMEKKVAMFMDIGATLTILFGIIQMVGLDFVMFQGGGYFHAKMTLVLVLLGIHGFVRVKVKKYGRGEVAPVPTAVLVAQELVVLAILIVAVVRPF